ncbi:MAG: Bacterial membrane protein YfhO [Chloroflexi bacterium ADurb.Bin360]|nr:MAG: Bacterial membrane protein YfhO [Chloroflexi bacterium ADurb.Bin360]
MRPYCRKPAQRTQTAEIYSLLLITAVAALFFWPVWIAGHTFPQGGGDLWGQLYPVWNYAAQWIRSGIFPLWSTRMLAGDPIIAEAQYGLLNPLNWPLFLFSPIPDKLVLLRGVFPLWWAGVGLYAYLRRSQLWGLHRSAALTGAVAYMLCDSFIIHLGHPQFNDAMSWLPWTLWAVECAARRARAIPLAAGALALIILSGHGQASLYSALAVGVAALWQLPAHDTRTSTKRGGRLFLVGLIAALLVAPALLPGLERLPFTVRGQTPTAERGGAQLTLNGLIDLVTPLYHGRGVRGSWLGWARMETGYIGLTGLLLAGLGLAASLKTRRAWFTLLLGGLAYSYARGYEGPIYPHLAELPIFAESWRTVRAIFVLSLALACAAALGMQALDATHRKALRCSAPVIGLLGAVLWFGAPGWLATVPAGAPQAQALTGLRLAAALCAGNALWYLIGSWRPALSRAGLLLLLITELVASGALVETEARAANPEPYADALAFLRSDPGWFRVDIDAAARGLWSPSGLQADGFDVPQSTGNPMDLQNALQFYWSIPDKGAPAYQLFGAKYIIVPKGAQPGGAGIWPVYTGNPWMDIHLNTNTLNRVWLVYETQSVADTGAAMLATLDPSFNPRRTAIIEQGPNLHGSGEHTLEVLAYGPNRTEFRIHTTETGLFVLSDTYYPGWEAHLDGQATPIYRVNAIFRGVVVPEGTHHLTLRYRPRAFKVGLGLASMAGILLMFLQTRRRNRRAHPDSASATPR